MSPLTTTSQLVDVTRLEKLSSSIRGKLQFLDYLVRAAVADVERYHDETDAGTRIFIRQLIEMHASNLASECDAMHSVQDFCQTLALALDGAPSDLHHGDAE